MFYISGTKYSAILNLIAKIYVIHSNNDKIFILSCESHVYICIQYITILIPCSNYN